MRLVLDDATARSDDGDEAATLRGEVERLTAANAYAEAEIARLTAIIAAFQRHRFGARSEKLDADQLDLALEEMDQALARVQAANDAAVATTREAKPRRTNRGALPAHLERIEQVITPPNTACPCCTKPMHVIGEDVAERLDVIPASFRVLVTRRPRYGCRGCEGAIVQASALPRIVEGGIPTEALVAHVVVGKYADHLPLYRQAQIYARQGVHLDRSTLADWVGRAAWWLTPLRDHLLGQLRRSAKLFADRDHLPRARSRARTHQDRTALGLRARRPALGRGRSARGRLCLRARPQGRAPDRAPRRFRGRAPGRRLCRLRRARATRRRAARLLLGACAAILFRARRQRHVARGDRGARAHREALRGRECRARATARRAPRRASRT